ncbi:4'-phosphopantetheinyl transferase family protein [Parvimonas micra]|uniref:4'-phosphopantetheinyl transferase family protein n=1 Tax=Parvimonas micra TaxID=33033 RepID=UPI00241C5A4B|nr:4'-phosphopantetheinyl transferase superfamily protein [Parvimonas micra]
MLKLYILYIDRNLTSDEYIYLSSLSDIVNTNYYKFEDCQNNIIGIALAQLAICESSNLKLEQLKISKNKYGKLFEKSCYFNISHCKNYVVCSLSDKMVGVDIEDIIQKDISIKTFDKHFTLEEQKYLQNSKTKRREAFTKLWVLKESYIKYLGYGLFIPLNSFGMKIKKSGIHVIKRNFRGKENFTLIKLKNEVYCSICSQSQEIVQVIFYSIETLLK